MKKYNVLVICSNFLGGIIFCFGQVGINTTTPEGILDVVSTTQGVRLSPTPLTTATDATTITNPKTGGTPAIGTLVYNDTSGGFAQEGLVYWNGSNWQSLGNSNLGAIKYSYQIVDHEGWYLLDGRSSSTGSIPANAQIMATALFGANLPNGDNLICKGRDTGETLGFVIAGSGYDVLLTRSNLPNFSVTLTTDTGGEHAHTGLTNTDAHNHGVRDYGSRTVNGGNNTDYTTIDNGHIATRTTSSNGSHNHFLQPSAAGNHSHNYTGVSTNNGILTAFNTMPKSMAANMFVYLGNK